MSADRPPIVRMGLKARQTGRNRKTGGPIGTRYPRQPALHTSKSDFQFFKKTGGVS